MGAGRAKELILTGRIIDAAQAAEWGIVNHVVAAHDLLSRGEALAAEIAQAAPAAVRLAKRVIDGWGGLDRGRRPEALARAYGAAERISGEGMHYRRDIGHRALARLPQQVVR